VPLRIEIGPRDLAKNAVAYARRDTGSKGSLSNDGIVASVKVVLIRHAYCDLTPMQDMLETIQKDMFAKALKIRDDRMKTVTKYVSMGICVSFNRCQMGGLWPCAGRQEHDPGTLLRAQGLRREDQGRQHSRVCVH
jgi:hypothetical protein